MVQFQMKCWQSINKQLSSLKNQLDQAVANEQDMTIQFDYAKREIQILQRALEEEKAKSANLQEALDTLKTEFFSVRRERDDSRTKAQQSSRKLFDSEAEQDILHKSKSDLQHQVDCLSAKPEKIEKMRLESLEALSVTIQGNHKVVDQAKDKLRKKKYCCTMCMERQKNMFLDGCGHMVCEQCESGIKIKKCPVCMAPYHMARKIVF